MIQSQIIDFFTNSQANQTKSMENHFKILQNQFDPIVLVFRAKAWHSVEIIPFPKFPLLQQYPLILPYKFNF